MSEATATRRATGARVAGAIARLPRRAAPCAIALAILATGPGALTDAHAQSGMRFDFDAAPVWQVDDARPIACPAPHGWNEIRAYIDDQWLWPADDLLAVRGRAPAQDVNALEEVPMSSWYAGGLVGPKPAPAVSTAPPSTSAANPAVARLDHSSPLDVQLARLDGDEPFLLVRDAKGQSFLLECDAPGAPELRSGAAIIAARLLRAAGYHALSGSIDRITRTELRAGTTARKLGEFGGEGDLSAKDLEHFFATPECRVAAFALPAGTWLGGARERGTRPDDANDRIPHENRRSLRGLFVLCEWLDHARIDETHTLDLFLTEGKFVRHYLAQLGSTLGATAGGHAATTTRGSATGGHAAATTQSSSPAAFGAPGFDPLAWHTRQPYAPFESLTPGDILWGVRTLMSIPPDAIDDAVAAAQYVDAEYAKQIAGALRDRRDRIARAWLGRVNGSDAFRVAQAAPGRYALALTDAGVQSGVRQPEDVYYAMTLRLPDTGERLGLQTRGGAAPAFDLVPFVPPAWVHRLDPRRYAIAEIRSWDHLGHSLEGSARVHIYFDRESGPRIVGIERD
jgi:hypothetical protein